MAASLIPFPEARVFRSCRLISILRSIENCERMVLSKDSLDVALATQMLPKYEADLAALGGVPGHLLHRDGLN